MLILYVYKFYLLSILSCLFDMKKLHVYMSFLSFICCWKYALVIIVATGIISEYLLKPLIIQHYIWH